MQFSENIADLSAALAEAQKELKNPANSADNPYFKSKYAPLQGILTLVRPILAKQGLSVIQSIDSTDAGIGVKTLLLHKSGQHILCEPYYMPLAKKDPQAAGSAITYARRYALTALLGICGDDEDDDGNNGSGHAQDGKPVANRAAQPKEKPKGENPITCPKCDGIVEDVKMKSGDVMSAKAFLDKYGMCAECVRKANA